MYLHSRSQDKSDSVQTLWALQKMFTKQKRFAFSNEVGNKLNKNKGLQYLFVTHKSHFSQSKMMYIFLDTKLI